MSEIDLSASMHALTETQGEALDQVLATLAEREEVAKRQAGASAGPGRTRRRPCLGWV